VSTDPNAARRFADLAEALKQATQRLREVQLSPDERDRLTRKLLAIASASKHDLQGAARRLRDLLGELSAAERAAEPSETPRHKESRADGG
jgi:hypothetical protein